MNVEFNVMLDWIPEGDVQDTSETHFENFGVGPSLWKWPTCDVTHSLANSDFGVPNTTTTTTSHVVLGMV